MSETIIITTNHIKYCILFFPALIISCYMSLRLMDIIGDPISTFVYVICFALCGVAIEHARLIRVGDIK